LVPQFEIGKYLKQLDPLYEHPLYRVDFLLLHRPSGGRERKIIIEYDGFKEHFREGAAFDAGNYEAYYSEEDVFRQKVLESYGYGFLRINRFNVGQNPIATLDERLRQATAAKSARSPQSILQTIHKSIEHLKDGELKECPKCRQLRPSEDFRDSLLASGTGRFCRHCKADRTPHRAKAKTVPTTVSPTAVAVRCPKCGSKMVLRSGRYGKFYGCSKFPYCRATRPVTAG
jgi:ssDNA-binding Zn-finger/Zn-ribbon topoisomerase 1